jgi:hypothetical protein
MQEACKNACSGFQVVDGGTQPTPDGVRGSMACDRMSEQMTPCHTQAGGGTCDPSPLSMALACSSSIVTVVPLPGVLSNVITPW